MITFLAILTIVAIIVGLYIVGLLGVFIGFSFLWGYNRHRKKLCRELHVAYQYSYVDSAIKSQSEIYYFLRKAGREVAAPTEEHQLWQVLSDRDPDIRFFIRMCHALGCEIVIRRVADHDIETYPDDPEITKLRNKKS